MSQDLVLKWGIVSAGLISQDFCTALQSLKSDKHKLVGVAARKLDDAKKLASQFQMPNSYDSYDALFKNKDINIVYIGAINTAHKDLCIAALNHGKNVLCEKPMCMNPKEQEEIFKVAKAKNLFFMEGLWTRFFPIIDKIKKEIADGAIGQLNFFSSNFMVPINKIDRIRNKKLGGGALLDIGIYPIQLACLFFNHEKPTKITCSGHLMDTGVDECCTIILTYPGQRIAQINISTNCTMFGTSFFIGDKGVIQIPEYSWCPTDYIVNNKLVVKSILPECPKTNFDRSVGLSFEAEAVRLAISKGLKEHPIATHDNSRLILHIITESMRQLGYVYE